MELTELAYNNSYQESIQMASFEVLYRHKFRSPLYWSDVGEKRILGPDILQEVEEKVKVIRRHLEIAQSRQRSYADTRQRSLEF